MPPHTQFLLVELGKGGPYAVILPLLPNNCKATLQPARYAAALPHLLLTPSHWPLCKPGTHSAASQRHACNHCAICPVIV